MGIRGVLLGSVLAVLSLMDAQPTSTVMAEVDIWEELAEIEVFTLKESVDGCPPWLKVLNCPKAGIFVFYKCCGVSCCRRFQGWLLALLGLVIALVILRWLIKLLRDVFCCRYRRWRKECDRKRKEKQRRRRLRRRDSTSDESDADVADGAGHELEELRITPSAPPTPSATDDKKTKRKGVKKWVEARREQKKREKENAKKLQEKAKRDEQPRPAELEPPGAGGLDDTQQEWIDEEAEAR